MLSKDVTDDVKDIEESLPPSPPPYDPEFTRYSPPAYNPAFVAGRPSSSSGKDHIEKSLSPSPPPYNPESTRYSPPAYNPAFVAGRPSSPSGKDHSCRSAASAPAQMHTIDPTIASILQQGFPAEYVKRDNAQQSAAETQALPEHVEYVIVDEPRDVPTTTKKHRVSATFITKNRPGTKANPPSAVRFIQLSHHRSRYEQLWPYAQVLAWKTKRMSKTALREALRLKRKHTPHVQAMAMRSATLIKETSQKSVRTVKTHAPRIKEQVQRASACTVNGIRDLEKKHQIWTKSKRGVKHGSRAMKDIWQKRHASVY
jgi:hypothetical protein